MPKVTVILTSYNHAKYLRDSIESILNQTFTDFELIIGDDASTDESWEIIQSYSDPRIFAYKHETTRQGIINELVLSGKISSDYIAIQHSDDVWEPQKLEKQVAFLNENPQIGAVFTNVTVIGENSELLKGNIHPYQIIFGQLNRSRYDWLNHFFNRGNALCHPSILIRKVCYTDCGVYRYGLAQLGDFDMWVRLCMKYDIHVLPEKLLRLRVRSNELNSSGNRPEVRIRGPFEYFEVLKNYRNITNPDELMRIFPVIEKYIKPDGFDLGFVLGMAALEPSTYNFTKLFGLELLIEALNDPPRAKKINNLYNFSISDFTALTAQYDVFSVELLSKLASQATQLAEQDQKISALVEEKNNVAQMLLEIQGSRAWKLVTLYRNVQARLLSTLKIRIK